MQHDSISIPFPEPRTDLFFAMDWAEFLTHNDRRLDDRLVIADRLALSDRVLDQWVRSRPHLLIDGGEAVKEWDRLGALLSDIVRYHPKRHTRLVAIGGGSVGDALGFAAGIFWRGLSLWQIPSTPLAWIDSSHGGKTGINFAGAKNQLGIYWMPEATVLLQNWNWSDPLWNDLKAELFKMALLDRPLFDQIAAYPNLASVDRTTIFQWMRLAVMKKLSLVATDPFEIKRLRFQLNLGHTLGHILEKRCSLSHGTAISYGLHFILEVSARWFGDPALSRLRTLYASFRPLAKLAEVPSWETIEPLLAHDKKRGPDGLVWVCLKTPGESALVSHQELSPYLREVYDGSFRDSFDGSC